MPRIPRMKLWTEAACYHIINRGHNRENIFTDEQDFLYFKTLLARYRTRFQIRLYHYCLMSNHFHLLLQLERPQALSSFMAGMLRSYVHYYHRRHGFFGHLWQGRFKSPAVEVDEYLLSCGRYIERNPLEAGIADRPWNYRWSSSAAYACGTPDGLLDENIWYMNMATDSNERQRRWRELVLGEDPRERRIRETDWVIGSEAFRRQMKSTRSRAVPRSKGRWSR